MMQDCTHIRSLTDSQTLLTWKKAGEITGKTIVTEQIGSDNENPKNSEYRQEASASVQKKATNAENNAHSIRRKLTPEEITADTFLKDIFADYPELKDRMEEINPKFKMLKTPLARIMLPKATVKIASERTGMELTLLLAEIKKRL